MVGLVGTIGAAGISAASAYAINQANIKANQSRWSDEINLANTQHQREVADLRLAGLNPILSTGTAGAAVPNQSAATQSNPMSDVAQGVSTAFRDYMTREVSKKNLEALQEEVKSLEKDNEYKSIENRMLQRQNWIEGLGVDDMRKRDNIHVSLPADDMRDLQEYRRLVREGIMSDALIRSRGSARQLYQDIMQGVDTATDIIPVKAFGKRILDRKMPVPAKNVIHHHFGPASTSRNKSGKKSSRPVYPGRPSKRP